MTKLSLPQLAGLLLSIITTFQAARADNILLSRGSSWKFNNANVDLDTAWLYLNYDDSAWGGPLPGPLGDDLEGAVQLVQSVIDIGPATNRFPTIYFRKTFYITNAALYEGLILRVMRDDAAFIYLNGNFVTNVGCGGNAETDPQTLPHTNYCCAASGAVAGADETTYFEYRVPSAFLADGTNVFAVEARQAAPTSSDLVFDLEAVGVIDTQPPVIADIDPAPNSVLTNLYYVTVTFDTPVRGVDAPDLLLNGNPATNLLVIDPRQYTFYFPAPATGQVQVAFASNHGITDTGASQNPFAGQSWTYYYDPNVLRPVDVTISEFMALNSNGIRDEDGNRSDWIELYNHGPFAVNLEGYFLTDTETNLTKWPFPAVLIQANGFLIVWASGKDRRDPTTPLHTNFKLAGSGEYLALVDPQTNVMSAFSPTYPAQREDISYGRDRVDPGIIGYFVTATPGAPNSVRGPGFMAEPAFSVESGVYTNDSLTIAISGPDGAAIHYTMDGSVPTTGSPNYTGPITTSSNLVIKARIFDASGALLPSPIVAKSYLLLDSSVSDFNSNLPLVIINTQSGIAENVVSGQPRTKGSLAVIETQAGRSTLRGPLQFHGLAEFEIFGQTASSFPKQPHIIEVQDEFGNDNEVSLLGMPPDADWRLLDDYTDKCLMNNFLAYELFEQMGHYQMRRRFVEVLRHTAGAKITSSDYYGVMVLAEKLELEEHRVNLARLSPTDNTEPRISGGYIFKKDKDSVGDLNFSTAGGGAFGAQTLKIHEPKPREVTSNQVAWLRAYLNQMEKSLYANDWLRATGTNHYSYYLDVDSFVDQFWIVEFTKQIDGYRLSAFFQKDRNGKIKPEPIFDWDRGFGNANFLDGGRSSGWYYTQLAPSDYPWAFHIIRGNFPTAPGIGDPSFCQKIADRWGVLRTNVLNGPRVVNRIGQLAAFLSESAGREFARFPRLGQYVWPNPDGAGRNGELNGTGVPWDVDYVHPLTYAGIIFELQQWMGARYTWIDSQFTIAPSASQPSGPVSNGTPIALSGPAGATIYYTLDGTDPFLAGSSNAPGALVYSGPITLHANAQLFARAKALSGSWQNTWSPPAIQTYVTDVPALRITEIMYHPAAPAVGDTNSAENFEYVEVQNIGGTPLNVNRFQLSGGVQFQFPNVVLDPAQYGVVVSDVAAFQARYGTGALILGTFTGHLNNAGDHLVLLGPLSEPILDFSYDDDWYRTTDGPGFSLVFDDATAAPETWNQAPGWRASASLNGSPGAADAAPPSRPAVVINELLSYGSTVPDALELYNPTSTDVDLGGWFLTDDFDNPKKFVIPSNTIVPAGGYLVLDETTFNASGTGFAFGSKGDAAYLFSGNGVDLTGYAHGYQFGAAEQDVTFGRYVTSTGEDLLVAQKSNTLGSLNSGPRIGPIIITEINYRPADFVVGTTGYENTIDEYVELQNISSNSLILSDGLGNGWRLGNAVSFDFPANTTIPAGGFLLVVGFDPIADPTALNGFRERMRVPVDLPIYGPWHGTLPDNGGQIELSKPRPPESDGSIVYVTVEQVRFGPALPTPSDGALAQFYKAPSALGLSLQRIVATSYGDDPTNWSAVGPTPGGPYIGGSPPTIISQPTNQLGLVGSNLVLSVSATGSEPLQYQWLFMNEPLAAATNANLVIPSFQMNQAGAYNILVYNGGGSALGGSFTVTGRVALAITAQPQNGLTLAGKTNIFSLTAVGTGPLRYQWYFNGNALARGTNSTLSITNVQANVEGNYFCTVSDDYGSITSDVVTLKGIFKPGFLLSPVTLTAVEGGSAYFSVVCTGSVPMSIRWRAQTNNTSGHFLDNEQTISGLTNSVLILANLPYSTNVLRITAIASNSAAIISSGPAFVTVLKDSDHDGLPDLWEINRVGFDLNDPADGTRDDDGDGMSNLAEYIAGTDYLDPGSNLKIQTVSPDIGKLRFTAVSNRTYTVQYTDSLDPIVWHKLADVFARTFTRLESVTDPGASSNRFYRLVIPIQP